jgi:ankyrin repeat protein
LLAEVKGLDLTTMSDKKHFTVVHSLVLNQNLGDLRFVVEYAKTTAQIKSESKEKIAEWLDSPSEGGFTALHYASYRGDIGMAIYLMQNGANMRAKNAKGLNVMHIAA